MEEKPNLGLGNLLPNHSRDQEQVVIVDPDCVTLLPVLNNFVRERLVDVDIVLPGMILVRLALGIVRNLVVEDGPQDLLAEVGIVTVEIFVGTEDTQHVMLRSEFVIDVLELLRAHEGVGWHSQGADPGVVSKLTITSSCLGGIAQATITLIGTNDLPVGMGKDTVMTLAAYEALWLRDALAAHLFGLLV